MKITRIVLALMFVVLALISASCGEVPSQSVSQIQSAAENATGNLSDGIAVSIVYDTSGSMSEGVKGDNRPKYEIANKAFVKAVENIHEYTKQIGYDGNPRTVFAQLVIFDGNRSVVAIPMSKFDKDNFISWINNYGGPNSNTPLGDAMCLALNGVLESKLSNMNILIISDGESNCGASPENATKLINSASYKAGVNINTYFIAFDIDASLFAPLKDNGVVMFSALDAKQLDTQLNYVVTKKILLEREE